MAIALLRTICNLAGWRFPYIFARTCVDGLRADKTDRDVDSTTVRLRR